MRCPLPHRHTGTPCTRCDAVDTTTDCPRTGRPMLCPGHEHRLIQDVAELPSLDEELDRAALSTGGQLGRHVQSTGLPAPREDIIKAREHIYADLSSWCRIVAEERHLTELPAARIGPMATWLGTHLPWAVGQAWAPELAVDMDITHREAWSVAFPSGRQRISVGECWEMTACEVDSRVLVACPGTLTATLDYEEAVGEVVGRVVCDTCGTDRSLAEMRRHAESLGRAPEWISPYEIAREHRVALGTVYRWASLGGWARTYDGVRVLYAVGDVTAWRLTA